MMSYQIFFIRLLFSLVLGVIIGLERQLTGHIAGIRINALICMGTCFFTMFPMLYGSKEVFRVGSSIVSGVGFLCSGAIFKENGSVRGINTAATLWCTAAIGILASTDKYMAAVIATGVLVLSNLILKPIAKRINPNISYDDSERMCKISAICQESAEPKIRKLLLNSSGCDTLFLNNLESGDVLGEKVEVVAEYYSVGKINHQILEEVVCAILDEPEVVKAGWEQIT